MFDSFLCSQNRKIFKFYILDDDDDDDDDENDEEECDDDSLLIFSRKVFSKTIRCQCVRALYYRPPFCGLKYD